MSNRVSCETCPAACCSGEEFMPLNSEEVRFMVESGNTGLVEILPADARANWKRHKGELPLPEVDDPAQAKLFVSAAKLLMGSLDKGDGLYYLPEKCANVGADNKCKRYEDRPDVCRAIKVGQAACKDARQQRGVSDGRPMLPLIVN